MEELTALTARAARQDQSPVATPQIPEDIPDNWYIVYCYAPDAGSILDESNAASFERMLGDDTELFGIWNVRSWAYPIYKLYAVSPEHPNVSDIVSATYFIAEEYPILDDMDYSSRQWEAIHNLWNQETECGRIQLIREYNDLVSIFAARRDEMPRELFDAIHSAGIYV